MTREAILEVKNLSHIFPDGTKAINNINLTIRTGELILLAGKNGSGKTVFMKHLNGLLTPTRGEVLWEGVPIQKDLIRCRTQIGFMFQNAAAQLVGQTVEQDVAFGPENLQLPRTQIQQQVAKALGICGIRHLAHKHPSRLSGGEKRKAAIAGLLAMNPTLLILDEPFIGLDYPGVKQLIRQILKLHKIGHTIVVISHDIEKILAHCTRLIIMEDGEIKAQGKPALLLDQVERYGIKGPPSPSSGIEGMTWLI